MISGMKHLPFCMAIMFGAPAFADPCPAPPDHSTELSALIEAAQNAPDQSAAREISNDMWALWADAPDDRAQALLDEAMARREVGDYAAAEKAADALVAYCPDYSEGYNQRAFVNFLRGEYAAALPDLESALERAPRHIAAMTGQALTLVALDRKAEAALVLRAALDLNPWLSERALLKVIEKEEETL